MTGKAAIYCRISDDREGQALGVARQEQDCRVLADRMNLSVSDDAVFVDNDISASTRSRKARPRYSELIARAHRGEFSAVVAYSNSRLTRRPLELEDLIKLHESTGIIIATVASGNDDLSTADGRMVARIKASVDAAEAERVSERLARKHRQSAETGRAVGGTRPFGWLDDRLRLDPIEASAARRAVDGFLAGKTLYALVNELTERGLTTTLGNPWTTVALRRYLGNPRLCGWRILHGEIVRNRDATPVIGDWQPIISSDEWEAVKGRLEGRRMRMYGRHGQTGQVYQPGWNSRKYLLSGFLRCGKTKPDGSLCMVGLRVSQHPDTSGHLYVCPPKQAGGCAGIGRHGPRLEFFVSEAVIARVESLKVTATESAWANEVELGSEIERRTRINAAWRLGRVTDETYFSQLELLEEAIQRLRSDRQMWQAEQAAKVQMPDDIRTEWERRADDLDWRRSVIGRHLRFVVVFPVGKGVRRYTADTARLAWRED